MALEERVPVRKMVSGEVLGWEGWVGVPLLVTNDCSGEAGLAFCILDCEEGMGWWGGYFVRGEDGM